MLSKRVARIAGVIIAACSVVVGAKIIDNRTCAEPTHIDWGFIDGVSPVYDTPVEAARAFIDDGGELVPEGAGGDLHVESRDGDVAVVTLDGARLTLTDSSFAGWRVRTVAKC